MKTVQDVGELALGRQPVCLAIGMFDGVHLGHQEVIAQTVAAARRADAATAAVTFDRHPNAIVAPDRTPPLIQSLAARLESLATLGLEATWLVRFDRPFADQTAREFVLALAQGVGCLRHVFVGRDFVFGRRRGGDLALLEQLGQELGFATTGLPPVLCEGAPVSSTWTREAVRAGDFALARRLLGRPYTLSGAVIRGAQRGRGLGFPTANLEVAGLVLPPNGVYAVRAAAGRAGRHAGVLNLGCRPTLAGADGELVAEVHLLEFAGDLYGDTLAVEFVARLRDERRFPSAAALQEQIRRDIAAAGERLRAGAAADA